jgi:acetyl esterase/lipase
MTLRRRDLLSATLATGIAALGADARAQTLPPTGPKPLPGGLVQPTETLDLWPGGAPGAPTPLPVEVVEERSTDPLLTDRAVRGISKPRLVVFRPERANGAAVMIAPGGGYRHVVIDKEGYELGRWFAARGITAFVLFYRLPGEGWAAGPDVALSDAQRAMRLIRSRAADFGIDPARLAAMGFSAGGHVCADLTTRFAAKTYEARDAADALSARPAVAAPIYPVVSMSAPLAHAGSREKLLGAAPTPALERTHSPHLNVGPETPPCFLLHAADDETVPVDNSLQLYAALRAERIPAELHVFEHGGHGFGLRKAAGKPVEAWPDLFVSWARTHGWPS